MHLGTTNIIFKSCKTGPIYENIVYYKPYHLLTLGSFQFIQLNLISEFWLVQLTFKHLLPSSMIVIGSNGSQIMTMLGCHTSGMNAVAIPFQLLL